MNNFFKIILLLIVGLNIASCSKSDNDTEPLRDFETQKINDMEYIETFMKTHSMTVSADFDVTYTLIPEGPTSIWNQTTYPILSRNVKVRQGDADVIYKIYYIKFREGTGKSPCNVDRVLTAYKGEYIYDRVETVSGNEIHTIVSNDFEEMVNPQSYFTLSSVIRGWSEIFPQFKTGTYTGNPDGTVSYNDYGAGVMFIPSGVAYYASSTGGIPSYSPLIFNFKLYEIQRVDNDGDGIYSYQEDLATSIVNNDGTLTIIPNVPDGYVYAFAEGIENPDNTNGPGSQVTLPSGRPSEEDEIPDFLDSDDDGDFFTTKSETMYVNPLDVLSTQRYYPFSGAVTDDPATPYVDETKGVPDCSGDFTTPTRLRKYLDPMCH
ncbi:FKBP-type peptidyl-prolyl cis-trans isomerase [Flavobacterium sp.]